MVQVVTQQPTLYNPTTQQLLRLLLPSDRVFPWELPGEWREYANGNVRLIRTAGLRNGAEQDVYVDAAGLALLREWAGEVLLYRDGLGHRLWCAYLSANATPSPNGQRFTVPLALRRLTYTEAV